MSRIKNHAEEVSHIADGIRDKAAEVTQNVREMGDKVKHAASETYGQVSDYVHQGRESAQAWEESLETYVQKKPLQAVLLAGGVGLLLGLLWKRR